MPFEDIQVADSGFDELWPDQVSAPFPFFSISCKDRVTQKVFPILMKSITLSVILKLSGEDCLDVLRISRENESLTSHCQLYSARMRWSSSKEEIPEFQKLVTQRVL